MALSWKQAFGMEEVSAPLEQAVVMEEDAALSEPQPSSVDASSTNKMEEGGMEKENPPLEQAVVMEEDAALSEPQSVSADASSTDEMDMEDENSSPMEENVLTAKSELDGDEGLTDADLDVIVGFLAKANETTVRKYMKILVKVLLTGWKWKDITKDKFGVSGETVSNRLNIWRKLDGWKSVVGYIQKNKPTLARDFPPYLLGNRKRR